MKESFELNAVKDEMTKMLTYCNRNAAICMLYNIMSYANKHTSISVFEIFDLNRKSIDFSWDQYGWTAEDIIIGSTLIISKTEDGKYRVIPNFSLIKRLDRWQSWNDISNNPIVKKEVLNEKPKEPKKRHEYGISGDSSYHIGHQHNGTLCKNDYLSYSIHINTTNPDVYHEIFDLAESLIAEAQNEEEED